jgi:hypothetical protein
MNPTTDRYVAWPVQLNIDSASDLSVEYGVFHVPSLLYFPRGRAGTFETWDGAIALPDLRRTLEQVRLYVRICERACVSCSTRACVRVRACVRACVRVLFYACVRACVRACECVRYRHGRAGALHSIGYCWSVGRRWTGTASRPAVRASATTRPAVRHLLPARFEARGIATFGPVPAQMGAGPSPGAGAPVGALALPYIVYKSRSERHLSADADRRDDSRLRGSTGGASGLAPWLRFFVEHISHDTL